MENDLLILLTLISGAFATYPIQFFIDFYNAFYSQNHTEKQQKVIKTGIAGIVSVSLAIALTMLFALQTNQNILDVVLNTLLAYAGSQAGYTAKKRLEV